MTWSNSVQCFEDDVMSLSNMVLLAAGASPNRRLATVALATELLSNHGVPVQPGSSPSTHPAGGAHDRSVLRLCVGLSEKVGDEGEEELDAVRVRRDSQSSH